MMVQKLIGFEPEQIEWLSKQQNSSEMIREIVWGMMQKEDKDAQKNLAQALMETKRDEYANEKYNILVKLPEYQAVRDKFVGKFGKLWWMMPNQNMKNEFVKFIEDELKEAGQ